MTVNDIITELNKIPARERCRPISLCGDAINCDSEETISEIEIDWIDCSDALVLLFNKVETQRGEWIYVSHNPCYSPFDDSPPDFYRCSCCGYITGNRTKHCPKCGKSINNP